MPKSMRRALPVESTRMLLGLTSRWTTPSRSSVSAVARKPTMGERVESASSTVIFLPMRRSFFARVSPSSHSSTMQLFSQAPKGDGTRTVPLASAWGSTRKFENFSRVRHSSSHSSPFSNAFTATGTPPGVRALKTVACPPRLATPSSTRLCGAWRMSLCGGNAGVKCSSEARSTPGDGAAGVPVPVRSSWLMVDLLCT